MKGASLVLWLWAVYLGVLTLVMWLFFPSDNSSIALLGGAAGATAIVGTALRLLSRRSPEADPDVERPVPDLSVAAGWTGLSIGLLVLSARVGVFLALLAGGMLLLGLAGLVRELRARPRVRGRP